MLNHRLRILASLLVAFLVVNLYGRISTTPFVQVNVTERAKNLLSNLKFPTLNLTKLFTLQFNPGNNEAVNQWNNESNNSFNFPTNGPIQPIPTSPAVVLTKAGPSPTKVPTVIPGQPTYTPTPIPTRTPTPKKTPTPTKTPTKTPTTTPRPTATPKPQPTATPAPPPIMSDVRPGTTLEEIFEEVNKRICVPAALLRAFQEEETGPWFKYYDNPVPYNTYGWWKTSSADPCKGFGYDAKTGYVPTDSYYAGRFCMITPGANPGIMGLFAIDQWEQDTTRKNTIEFLPNNIDRRVIFDNAIIFASATINRVGNQAPACGEDWSDTVINIAAAKHVSGQYPCSNATCEKYCNDILSLYKQYR